MKPKKILIYAIKVLVSALAISYVVSTVGSSELISVISGSNLFYILIALFLYVGSQWVSTHRLGYALKTIDINIPFRENFKLYFIGMAYNLFLPGGIGGDAYKVVYLGNSYQANRKITIAALLLDRLMGLLAILIIIGIIASITPGLNSIYLYSWCLVVPLVFLAFLGVRWIFPTFRKAFKSLLLYSLAIQFIQAAAVIILAKGFSVDPLIPVLLSFFLSTVATAIPIFLGGIGAREMVFQQFAAFNDLNESTMLGIAILFSLITLISALPGLLLDWRKPVKV